ncbi:MAG: hypothetical protein ABSF82_08400 [Candidatus Bathyarchaeia archaeon]
MRLHLLLLWFLAPLWASPFAAHVIGCQITITRMDFPANVNPNQTVAVKTQLEATCSKSAIDIAGRVDLIDPASNKSFSTQSIHVGFVSVLNQAYNFTVINNAQAPPTAGVWKLDLVAILLAGGIIVGSTHSSFQIAVTQLPQQTVTTVTTTSTSSHTTLSTTTTTKAPPSGSSIPLTGLMLVVIVISAISLFLVKARKKRPSPEREAGVVGDAHPVVASKPEESCMPTGYPPLDSALDGGLPLGYSVLLLSPQCNETDLLLERIIASGISTSRTVFFVSRDLGRTRDLADRYKRNLHAFSPQADKIIPARPNIHKIPGVQSLNELNISLANILEPLIDPSASKILIMDILSDALLEHQAARTRKWMDDFLARKKAEGFTILCVMNPLITTQAETQTIADLFDGIIEISEKQIGGRSRMSLVVKRMYARKCPETELVLDRNMLSPR